MEVITEELLRQKWRQKELAEGGKIFCNTGTVITPAAKSFLQEHHVQLLEENRSSLEKKKLPKLGVDYPQENKVADERIWQIQLLLKKLRNLFYFPLLADGFFSGATWLFIEQQQMWLTEFSKKVAAQKNSLTFVKTQECAEFTENNSRSWHYYQGELCILLEELLHLLSDEKIAQELKNLFEQWMQEMLRYFKLIEIKGGKSCARL